MNGCRVYVLECGDGSFYTGWTVDLARRLAAHRSGQGSRYVRARLPVRLLASWPLADRSAALREEARFKRLSRARKCMELVARGVVLEHDVAPCTSTKAQGALSKSGLAAEGGRGARAASRSVR